MQGSHEAGGNDAYFARRDLHPRTGDCAAFSGRTSTNDISPRSDYHDDVMAPFQSRLSTESQTMPSEADVELEGVTADGGLALNVGFDSTSHSSSHQHPEHQPAAKAQGNLDGQVAATQPYKTAAQAHPHRAHHHTPAKRVVPPLAIVLMCAGTRGDVQPFIALGLSLQECGHRVRVASHAAYRKFVTSFGLEFYPLGGDPKVLSDYIVKNRGIMPGSARDAYDQYREVESIVMSTYKACVDTDTEGNGDPFTAQAIISNPPTYGHIHCAEKLGIPLQMFFTMPWSPTKAFPHPLARLNAVKDTKAAGYRNLLSYMAVDEFTYTGLVHVINKFRVKTLGLAPVRLGNKGPHLLAAHQVPFAYCWSEALVPKPADWGNHIDVVGYCFLNEGKHMKYNPPEELKAFLAAGPPPVYIGFGSLLVDDAKKLTTIILESAKETGQRVLLSRGWGGLGEGFDVPDTVLLLDNVPHDWLLPQCSAVVHHGGAGTTAAGLIAGCPTTVVPFFGDQPFWGAACARMGVGPKPIPIDKLDTPSLVEALKFMMKPEVQAAAKETGLGIKHEDGLKKAVDAFHAHLPLEQMEERVPLNWHLTKPHFGNFVSETGRGVVGIFSEPVRGYREGGFLGTIKGVGKGLGGAVYYPLKGLGLSAADVGLHAVNAGLLVKTTTAEQLHGAKGCIHGTSTKGDHEDHSDALGERPLSQTELAAQQELNPLAQARQDEAEEYNSEEEEDDEKRQSPVKRRFAVRFSHISEHLPSITQRWPRFSRNSKDTRSSKDLIDSANEAQSPDKAGKAELTGQPAAAPPVANSPETAREGRASADSAQRPAVPTSVADEAAVQPAAALTDSEPVQAAGKPSDIKPGQWSSTPIL